MTFKLAGLLIVAIATTLASAPVASADYVSGTTGGSAETPTIHMVNESGHVTVRNVIAAISCASTIEGTVKSHGAGSPVSGSFANVSFTGCTNSWHFTTITAGSFEIVWENGHNGLVYSTGLKIDATRFGVTCEYETNSTYIGTLSGGSPATLTLGGSLPINISTSSGLCGTGPDKWEGSYVTTNALYVADS